MQCDALSSSDTLSSSLSNGTNVAVADTAALRRRAVMISPQSVAHLRVWHCCHLLMISGAQGEQPRHANVSSAASHADDVRRPPTAPDERDGPSASPSDRDSDIHIGGGPFGGGSHSAA
mmetsp:Transcript_8101/g.19770  ORF Transcript_8101/g.19770 Transcript_8101/m.19770 type:complete len:119 (+) Transcript_8101:1134-1490(+)